MIAGVLVAVAAAPAIAEAATVRVVPCEPGSRYCSPYWTFTAAPGERNDMSASGDGVSVTRIRDAGAPLQAGEGCQAVSEHEALCRGEGGFVDVGDGDDRVAAGGVQIKLGDGDDRMDRGGTYAEGGPGNDVMLGGTGIVHWDGGDGNDVLEAERGWVNPYGTAVDLSGGPGADTLIGGPGGDHLIGGPGDDRARGGAGDDIFSDVRPYTAEPGTDDDVLEGDEGNDAVSYARRSQPVAVDLGDAAPDGSAGERDTLMSIETVAGSRGDDVLSGDGLDNGLVGGPGNDSLAGSAGADDLEGGEGYDRYSGGDGNDLLHAGVGWRFYYFVDPSSRSPNEFVTDPSDEKLDCGGGEDLVATFLDSPDVSCEAARFVAFTGYAAFPLRASFEQESVVFAVPCPRPLRVRRRCRGVLVVRGDGVLERRRFALRARGGGVHIPRWLNAGAGGERIQVRLRYDARPTVSERPGGPYGLNTYMTLTRPPSP